MVEVILRQSIQQLIDQNALRVPVGEFLYHANLPHRRFLKHYPQFFGTLKSAQNYLTENKQYHLYRYQVNQHPMVLLDMTVGHIHSKQISRLYGLIKDLIRISNLTTSEKNKRLDDLEVIALFTNLVYGLNIPYDPQRVNHVVQLASQRTYPLSEIRFDYIDKLLQLTQSGRCLPSRVSFETLDKMLMNALTFVIEACNLPIDGVFFKADEYTPEDCCSYVNNYNPKWQTCVSTEYVLFRPDKHLKLI